MNCCDGTGCQDFFSEKVARRDARRYRKKGLTGPARRIADTLRAHIGGATVLEVGGGVGALRLELLKAGAERGVNVELSPAYATEAGELVREAGLEGRAEHRVLDFAQHPESVEPADVVVLNKVVCCYPDYEGLLGPAADRARRSLVFSFPAEHWYIRLGVTVANGVLRLRRSSFRSFVHPVAAMRRIVEERGLRLTYGHRGRLWQVVAFERAA